MFFAPKLTSQVKMYINDQIDVMQSVQIESVLDSILHDRDRQEINDDDIHKFFVDFAKLFYERLYPTSVVSDTTKLDEDVRIATVKYAAFLPAAVKFLLKMQPFSTLKVFTKPTFIERIFDFFSLPLPSYIFHSSETIFNQYDKKDSVFIVDDIFYNDVVRFFEYLITPDAEYELHFTKTDVSTSYYKLVQTTCPLRTKMPTTVTLEVVISDVVVSFAFDSSEICSKFYVEFKSLYDIRSCMFYSICVLLRLFSDLLECVYAVQRTKLTLNHTLFSPISVSSWAKDRSREEILSATKQYRGA